MIHPTLQLFNTDSTSYFLETSEVDPKQRTHKSSSTNLTFANVLSLREQVEYRPNPSHTNEFVFFYIILHFFLFLCFVFAIGFYRTIMLQSFSADVSASIAGARSYVEDFCLNRFQANAERVSLRNYLNPIENMLRGEKDLKK